MKRILLLVLLISFYLSASAQRSPHAGPKPVIKPPHQAAGYTLSFDDEFNGPLDISGDGLGVHNWYNWYPSPSPLGNIASTPGGLKLTWLNTQPYWLTTISTLASDYGFYHAWQYGYFEVSMRWDTVTGAWPALWMMPIEDIRGTGHGGEIDIFEGQGATPNLFFGTLHEWQNGVSIYSNINNTYPVSADLSKSHTYGLLWTPGQITWYLDNVPLHSEPTPSIFDSLHFFLILTMSEGSNWIGNDRTGVTATDINMNVDWVRVWTK